MTTHETIRPTVPLPEGSGTYGGDDGPVGPDMTKAMRMAVFLNCGRGVQIEVRNAQRDLNGRRTSGAVLKYWAEIVAWLPCLVERVAA